MNRGTVPLFTPKLFSVSAAIPSFPCIYINVSDEKALNKEKKKPHSGQEEKDMNNNMKELNLNEMEQVNGAGFFDWPEKKAKEVIDTVMEEARKLLPMA